MTRSAGYTARSSGQIGYHPLDYFLNQWDKFKDQPLGVLAHSTHVRGGGTFVNGVEAPRIKVTLASKISEDECKKLSLGYLDPASIKIKDWEGKEAEGILYVPNAGEDPISPEVGGEADPAARATDPADHGRWLIAR